MKSATALDEKTIGKLRVMAETAGGVEPLSRRLDIPADTLRRALGGGGVRRGTLLLIEKGLSAGAK